jgi:hypothetical protein
MLWCINIKIRESHVIENKNVRIKAAAYSFPLSPPNLGRHFNRHKTLVVFLKPKCQFGKKALGKQRLIFRLGIGINLIQLISGKFI